MGFSSCFDFFYLPMDIHNRSNVGYAFINFLSPEEALRFRISFIGHEFQRFRSRKVGTVCDAFLQGLEANIRHFQHRAVSMSRNDQYRPAVIRDNQRMKFEDAVAEVERLNAASLESLDLEVRVAAPTLLTRIEAIASFPGQSEKGDWEIQEDHGDCFQNVGAPPGLLPCEVKAEVAHPRQSLEAAIKRMLDEHSSPAKEPEVEHVSDDILHLIELKNLLNHRLLESRRFI